MDEDRRRREAKACPRKLAIERAEIEERYRLIDEQNERDGKKLFTGPGPLRRGAAGGRLALRPRR
jgi:hypothetical protein